MGPDTARLATSSTSARRCVRRALLCFSFLVAAMPLSSQSSAPSRRSTAAPMPQVIAYVFPNLPGDRPLAPSDIPAAQLTRINYAFALIKDGVVVEGAPGDTANLAMLCALRKSNPSLRVLVSVGGWLGSGGFSDAVLTPASRQKFVESALSFLNRHQLDGLDLDWEYPGLPGAGNTFRPEDGRNFALLLHELHTSFHGPHAPHGRSLLLTIAAGSSAQYLEHTPMAEIAPSLDTVNLMTYDFYEAGETPNLTGNHAPLFADPADPQQASSAVMVDAFRRAGVPSEKIVLGVPFYGRAWKGVPPTNDGLFQTGTADHTIHTDAVSLEKLQNQGFTRHWDKASQVPYLYNASTGQFVSYEDPESLRRKCAYLREQHLGGIMFWQLLSDTSGQLIQAIHTSLASGSTAEQSPAPSKSLETLNP